MTAAQRERSALVSTFRQVGPDAPTLCAGWNTRDLAAHLVVRERRLDATPGITLPFLAGYTEKVQNKVAQSTGWDELVNLVSSGPPIYSPFKLLDSVANLGEMFIHHEDVRRAIDGWQPRVLYESLASPATRRSCCSWSRAVMPCGSSSVATPRRSPRSGRHPAACSAGLRRRVAEQVPQGLFEVRAAESVICLLQARRQHPLVGARACAR